MSLDASKSAKLYQVKASGVQHQYGLQLLEHLDVRPGQIICDIGCGCGALSAELAKLVSNTGKVIGIDPNINRIKVARREYGNLKHVTFLPVKSIHFPNRENTRPYDAFISNAVLHWIPTQEKRKTFVRIMKNLKPGGLFVGNISFYRSENMKMATSMLSQEEQEEIDSFYYRENPQILQELLLEAGFEIVKFCYRYKEMNMGSVGNFLEWISSTYYGKFDFKTAYARKKENVEFVRMEDGGLKHTSEGALFVVRKPIVESTLQITCPPNHEEID